MIATLPGFRQRVTARRRGVAPGLMVDLFAGAGGASLGIESATGRAVDVAVNHSRLAVEAHEINHPATRHLRCDVWEVDPVEVCGGRPVDLLWASPDCRHFSKAKGGRPVSRRVRSLAWVVVRWAKKVRPAVIMLENVEEFSTWGPLVGDRPCPNRKGETFRRWVRSLEALGYRVEWRELVAADFGAPTTRKRLFLVARCDGRRIRWPEPTHAPRDRAAALGLLPWRAAAECIDWSLPCPSIFERARPLAEATMRRIANGLRRYVLEAQEPFIVLCNHSGPEFRGQSLHEPMRTLTASRDARGVVMPFVVRSGHWSHRTGEGFGFRGQRVTEPLGTVCRVNDKAVVQASLSPCVMTNTSGHPGRPVTAPLPTQTSGNHHALVAAFLAKHYGGVVGHDLHRPVGTITSKDHHSLVSAFLSGAGGSAYAAKPKPIDQPFNTVMCQDRRALVCAFLATYYGNDREGQSLADPMRTVTSRDRFGLVMVEGELYQLVDIGLRMLQPHELLRAQFGRFADEYVLLGTKSQQVAAIGNSVCPEVAEALVACNVGARKAVQA